MDDPVGGYKSDYDLLVVVDNDRLTDVAEYWTEASFTVIGDRRTAGSGRVWSMPS